MSKETQKKIVVDIGNTHCKWGRVEGDYVVEKAVLPLDNSDDSWGQQLAKWDLLKTSRFILSGVNPRVMYDLGVWLGVGGRRHIAKSIYRNQDVPIQIAVDFPKKVGIDRLLNAVAVEQKPAIIIDAGSAVTVDAVNEAGDFLGGGIFPGVRLMAEALHQFTAQLPKVDITFPAPNLPGKNTVDAIHAGIVRAVVGGIMECVRDLQQFLGNQAAIYLTGGNGPGLRPYLKLNVIEAPLLTLQGILVAARALNRV